MNHMVVRSVVRGLLVNRSRGGRYISTAVAATTGGVFKPVQIWTDFRSRSGAAFGVFYWRRMMSAAAETAVVEKEKKESSVGKVAEKGVESVKADEDATVSSYWGIVRPKIMREDGTEWPWNCFMPWESYHSNVSIDLNKHHVPKTFVDKVAYRTVKTLRIPTDIFFQA